MNPRDHVSDFGERFTAAGREVGKLGARPHVPTHTDFWLGDFVKADEPLPYAKSGYGHTAFEPRQGWGMFGNNAWGDCVEAGGVHETMIFTHSGSGAAARFTDQSWTEFYGAMGGGPQTGQDPGTDPVQAAGWRRNTGIADADGKRHKIGAYVLLEAGNWLETLQALYAFEVVAYCFAVPQSAIDQFGQGKAWSYQYDTNIVGYHYVPIVGRPRSGVLNCITWGQVQPMTAAFFRHYAVDGTLAYVSQEMLNSQGKSPEGLDIAKLNDTLSRLGK